MTNWYGWCTVTVEVCGLDLSWHLVFEYASLWVSPSRWCSVGHKTHICIGTLHEVLHIGSWVWSSQIKFNVERIIKSKLLDRLSWLIFICLTKVGVQLKNRLNKFHFKMKEQKYFRNVITITGALFEHGSLHVIEWTLWYVGLISMECCQLILHIVLSLSGIVESLEFPKLMVVILIQQQLGIFGRLGLLFFFTDCDGTK